MKYVFKSSDERNVGQTEACRPLQKKWRRGEEKARRVKQGKKRQGGKGWREGKKEGSGGVISKL